MDIPRILVVEDERIVVAEPRQRLRNLGYDVPALAHSGVQAIELAERLRPDLVLMDIYLEGDMDGVQAAEQIRRQVGIPVIYLTAYGNQEVLERAKVTEPFGYILKPFEERELRIVIEMALSRHRMEQKLDEERRWFTAIVESSGDAIIGLTSEALITSWNPAAERLHGYAAREVVGQPFSLVVPSDCEEQWREILPRLRSGVAVSPFETLQLRKDGSTVPVLVSAASVKDSAGRILGLSTIVHDMTERKRAEEQSRQAQEMESCATGRGRGRRADPGTA